MNTAEAKNFIGLNISSWQEEVPVILNAESKKISTTMSALGFNYNYEVILTKSRRYIATVFGKYLSGRADLQQQQESDSPRRNMKSIWTGGGLYWRLSNSFNFGPTILLNQTIIEGLDPALNTGFMFNVNYDIYQNMQFIHSIGSISSTKQLAYSIGLSLSF